MSANTSYQAEALNALNQKYAAEADKLITEGLHSCTLNDKKVLENVIQQAILVFTKWDDLIKDINNIASEEYIQTKFMFDKLQDEYKNITSTDIVVRDVEEIINKFKEMDAQFDAKETFAEERGFFSRLLL